MKESLPVHNVFDRIIDSFAVLAGFLFVFSTVSTFVEVVMRYFFAKPTNWLSEINELILYVAPFIASAWILKNEGHVRMDLLVNFLDHRNQTLLNGVTSILGALICLTIMWFGATVTLDSFQTQYLTASGYIRVTRGYITLFGVLGCMLLAIQFIRGAISYFRQVSRLGRPK